MSQTIIKASLFALIGVDDDLIADHLESVKSMKDSDPEYGSKTDECGCETDEEAARCLAHEEMLKGNMDIKDWSYSLKTS